MYVKKINNWNYIHAWEIGRRVWKKRNLHMIFIDLEEAYSRKLREIICRILEKKYVRKRYINELVSIHFTYRWYYRAYSDQVPWYMFIYGINQTRAGVNYNLEWWREALEFWTKTKYVECKFSSKRQWSNRLDTVVGEKVTQPKQFHYFYQLYIIMGK